MEKVTIYPSTELKKQLEDGAKEDGRSLNNFILWILNKYTNKNERPKTDNKD